MHFHIITLFRNAFDSYLGESILKRAIEDKKIKVSFYNPRDFTKDKHKRTRPNDRSHSVGRVDRQPYAGGPGMVIQAEPVIAAVAKAMAGRRKQDVKIIFLSPSGKQFTNSYAIKTTKKYKNIIIICGRYEGIDARVKKVFKTDEISIGPFVLTGGELPAMIIVDTMARQVEGVLGNFDSLEERRTNTPDVYTRPETFIYKGKSYRVPKVLLSGNHAEIEKWKKKRT